jgi:UDP-N-acetyl-D-mannosaminuronate dehydrogenase
VVERVAELLNEHRKPLNGSDVLLLGVTYKADIADQRESPAMPVAELLRERGANIRFHDPMVDTWGLESGAVTREASLEDAVQEADIVVVLQAHQSYDLGRLAQEATVLLDTRGTAPKPAILL